MRARQMNYQMARYGVSMMGMISGPESGRPTGICTAADDDWNFSWLWPGGFAQVNFGG